MTESIILCEGFHDRAFWAGWLKLLGCRSLLQTTSAGIPKPVLDPRGKKVDRGQYAYASSSGAFIRLMPCGGDEKVLKEARQLLDGRSTRPITRLIVNLDADIDAEDIGGRDARRRIEDLVSKAAPDAVLRDGDHHLADGCIVSPLIWSAALPVTDGVPDKQTLERVVCGGLAIAGPDRAAAVAKWLASRPSPPARAEHKACAWSYMAGWYADRGSESFYEGIWDDAEVAGRLRESLTASGAWRVAERLAQ